MNFKKTYWEVVETKDDLSQLREQASNNTIKELAGLYGVSYSKMATVLRVNDIKAKRLKIIRKIKKIKKVKKIMLPKKDHELTKWASCQNKGKIRNVYYNMLKRCHDPKNKGYKYYGARGITVCDEWRKDCCIFYKWARDNGYNETLQLDRIDNNKGYSPDNCRWVTPLENSYNKRNTRKVMYKGEVHTLLEWEAITGISKIVLADRIFKYKWTAEKALTTPVKSNNVR